MSSLRMVYFTRLLLGFLTFLGLHSTAQCQLDETAFISDAQCCRAASFVNATCPTSSSIALINIRVGTRQTAQGCLGNETNGDGTDCCLSASDAGESNACEFDFSISDNVLYHDQCNGIQLCQPGVEIIAVIHGSCNTSVYPAFTQYMYFNFSCIEDSRIASMNSSHLTMENATLYLQSPGYTSSGISSSVSELSCSVETDNCDAAILIYVIERNLADVLNSTLCDQTQSLSIIEEDGSTLVNWTCTDNTYTISQPLQTAGNYILVNLTNTMSTDGGRFWTGFQASLPANLTLACPAVDKQYCFPTTTTTSTTSTSTASTSPSTTSTTTSSTTTSSTTTKTTKSSTSSTTKTNSSISTTSTTSTTNRTTPTTSTTKSTSSSVSTQRTVTLTTLTTRISTSRPNNGGNTNNALVTPIAISGGVAFVGLISATVFCYIKKRGRQKRKPDPKPPVRISPTPSLPPTPPPTPTTPTPAIPTPPPTPPPPPPPPPPPTPTTPTPPPTPPPPPPTSPTSTPSTPTSPPTPPPTPTSPTPPPTPPPTPTTPTPPPPPPSTPSTPTSPPTPPPTPTSPTPPPTPPPTPISPTPSIPTPPPTPTPPSPTQRRISSNMCRRYYKDLLKSLAEDSFLLMIYSEQKNRRQKKRGIKRNSVNPKRL